MIKYWIQDWIKELLTYNPDTGIFTWNESGKGKKLNQEAGTLDKNGYRKIYIGKKCVGSHRLAFLYMTGKLPKNQIDHINGDRTDNRWKNLREVTAKDNRRNSKLLAINNTGISGVFFYKPLNKWQAMINSSTYLGRYDDFFNACCVRKSAENKHNYHINHGR